MFPAGDRKQRRECLRELEKSEMGTRSYSGFGRWGELILKIILVQT
jgi:hypothetical protein